jgi:hypothetical protein
MADMEMVGGGGTLRKGSSAKFFRAFYFVIGVRFALGTGER